MLRVLVKPKSRWVRASIVVQLTGWNSGKMRSARESGAIDWKKDKDGSLWYDLNSLHPALIKSNTDSNAKSNLDTHRQREEQEQ